LLLSYSVVKEPTSAKGRQSCQTLTSVSSGSASSHEADPSDADTPTALEMLLERSAGSNCLRRLQGPGSVRSGCPFVNYEFPWRPPVPRIMDNQSVCIAIPASLAAQPAVQIRVKPVFQRSRTAQGPAVTTLPQVLFQRFRCRGRIAEATSPVARPTEKSVHPDACRASPMRLSSVIDNSRNPPERRTWKRSVGTDM
jgi:hypothetical protein